MTTAVFHCEGKVDVLIALLIMSHDWFKMNGSAMRRILIERLSFPVAFLKPIALRVMMISLGVICSSDVRAQEVDGEVVVLLSVDGLLTVHSEFVMEVVFV